MADIITSSNGRINNNIPKKLFRVSTENKNLLAQAGSLYYGTGETEVVTIEADNGTQTYQIPVTKAVEPPDGGIKNDAVYGIKFYVRNNQTIATAQMIEIPYTPSVAGIYLWNNYLSEPSNWSMQYVNFVSTSTTSVASVKYTAIKWEAYTLYYVPEVGDEPTRVYYYDESEGPKSGIWVDPGYKTINFSTTPQLVSKAFYFDFITNATQQ